MNYKEHVISTKNEYCTSPFGMRTLRGVWQMHYGYDIVDAGRRELTADVGILAFEAGVVVVAKKGSKDCGNYVDIAHDIGGRKWLTRYFHMNGASPKVKQGDAVKKGDLLGIMGTTGDSTGIHLHFQLNENSTYQSNGTPVDPEPYLTGAKTLSGAPSVAAPPPLPTVEQLTLKKGMKVRVLNPLTYEGNPFKLWYETYDVIQVSGDRIVIGIGTTTTAAVHARNLERVA